MGILEGKGIAQPKRRIADMNKKARNTKDLKLRIGLFFIQKVF